MDFEVLDAWLEQLKPAPKVDGMSMLDGYLAAIVIGPCSIPPHEWFFDLLGEKGNIATAQGKQLNAIMAPSAKSCPQHHRNTRRSSNAPTVAWCWPGLGAWDLSQR